MITIQQIISNLSTGQSSIRISSILKDLDIFYKAIRPRIRVIYAENELDGTTVYFKIPSQHETKILYDIVIWFDSEEDITPLTKIKVYSNSPYFGYNFAYLFNLQNSLLYSSMYPNVFKTDAPKMRNPLETVSFDKHVYSALRDISRSNLKNVIVQTEEDRKPKIKTFEQKQKEIQDLRDRKRKFMAKPKKK